MAISRKRSFRSRIFVTFFLAFSLFAAAILFFQYNREKNYRTEQLENSLDNLSKLAHNYIIENKLTKSKQFGQLDSLVALFPIKNIRLTIIDPKGKVMYDSEANVATMENHFNRPEVQKSLYSQKGSSIRTSATTNQAYYYYSLSYPDYFVRTAVVYDVQIKDFLKTERIFIVFILTIFILMWLLIVQLTKRIGAFISQLRDFAVSAAFGEEIETLPDFPDRELDVIGKKIVDIYNSLNKAKYKLELEKNKLFEHLNAVEEGIAIFSKKDELKLSNSRFVQYSNQLSDQSTVSLPNIFKIESLKPVVQFIRQQQKKNLYNESNLPSEELVVNAGEHYFQIKAIVFADKSFELLITDVTRLEKRRLLKQQLTSNIAHELKTPVTSMKGYLETILNNENIPEDKKQHFIERAFIQSERLTELLNDISLLNNIEDAGELFEFRKLKIIDQIQEVIENRSLQLEEKQIECIVDVKGDVEVSGNESLVSSVFQNLVENTIKYAGDGVQIIIRNYHNDEKRHYFSYVDTGGGIPEEHQARIFERFYRIDEGRTREKGGTGLGLSIVKNAIQLHKGEITVRNRPEGGVEFLFSFPKA